MGFKDIIGFKAEIGRQLEDAREFEEAAKIVYDDARHNSARLQEVMVILEDYRGERRNSSRTYNPPVSDKTKAKQVEVMVTDILRVHGPLKNEDIFARMMENGGIEKLPGVPLTSALLATYLTRMFRRDEPVVAYDRETRLYSLVEGK